VELEFFPEERVWKNRRKETSKKFPNSQGGMITNRDWGQGSKFFIGLVSLSGEGLILRSRLFGLESMDKRATPEPLQIVVAW